MDTHALLKLHIEWGADEALDVAPRNRLIDPIAVAPPPAPVIEARPRPVYPAAGGAVAQAEALAASCHSLADLRAALAGFDACALQATAIHLVFADGNPDAGLMLVGDAPGEAEDRSGIPFSGAAGALLDRMLASIGLDRQSALLTCAIPWRPPGNRKPTDHERQLCLPFLHRQIALTRPRRLLLLGQLALSSLHPVAGGTLRRLRGKWLTITIPGLDAPIDALPSYAPDQLIATPAGKREAWEDLLTLRLALDNDAKPPLDITNT